MSDYVDEIKKILQDPNLTEEDKEEEIKLYPKEDVAEAKRQLATSGSSSGSSSRASSPPDDERKEDSASEWSGEEESSSESSSSSEDSDSDSDSDFDSLTPEQKRAKLKANQEEGEFGGDDEYDDDLAVDDEPMEGVVFEGVPVQNRKKFDNATVKANRDDIKRLQKELYDSAPEIIKYVLLTLMRNGISNEWIRRYKPDTELVPVVNEAVLQAGGNNFFRRFERKGLGEYKSFTLSPMESKTYDPETETDTNPYFEKDVLLFTVHTKSGSSGHLMAVIKYMDKDGNYHELMFDSNGTGGKHLDELKSNGEINLENLKVVKNFRPHDLEFESQLAKNIFIDTAGRCASWALFVLMCFEPVLHMEKGEARDNAIKDITQFLEQFHGKRNMERTRVMSTLIVGLFTRLQLWGDDYMWFKEFRTSKQQAYLMPDFVKTFEAKQYWLDLKLYKARVEKETQEWLNRDNMFSSYYHDMFGFKRTESSGSQGNISEDVRKIVKGGSVTLTPSRFRAQGTVLYLQMPISAHFAPFDYHTGYNIRKKNGELDFLGNERTGGKDGVVTLTFGVIHKEIKEKTGKNLAQITWRDVLNDVRAKIGKNATYWQEINELTDFDALKLFNYEDDDQTVTYGDFKSEIDDEFAWGTLQGEKEKIEEAGWELPENEDEDDYILHVRQDTMWSKMIEAFGATKDNNNWPVLLDKPFPFHFYSKFNDSRDEYEEKLNPRRQPKPLKNKIYLTFDHATENRLNDLKQGVIFQRTEEFLNKWVTMGMSINSYNRYRAGLADGRGVSTHKPIPKDFGRRDKDTDKRLSDDELKKRRRKQGWIFASRNKLKNYYRYSEEWYSTDKFDRRMTLWQHQHGASGSLVLNIPHNLKLTIRNKEGKQHRWWRVPKFNKLEQLKTLYCLKRAMNPQFERDNMRLNDNSQEITYPRWNEMCICHLKPNETTGRKNPTQMFNLPFFDRILYPVNTYRRRQFEDLASGGHFVNKEVHTRQYALRDLSKPKFEIYGEVSFKLNYCFELDWPPKREGHVYIPTPVRIWTQLKVRGTISAAHFKGADLPRTEKDFYVNRPQWYYEVRVRRAEFVSNTPYKVEIGKESSSGRQTFDKGRWQTVNGRGVLKASRKLDTYMGTLGWDSYNDRYYDLEEHTRFYLSKQILGDYIKVALEDFGLIKKKKKKDVVDLTGDEGSSSSAVGKKRKKPGVVEALDFPQLKL